MWYRPTTADCAGRLTRWLALVLSHPLTCVHLFRSAAQHRSVNTFTDSSPPLTVFSAQPPSHRVCVCASLAQVRGGTARPRTGRLHGGLVGRLPTTGQQQRRLHTQRYGSSADSTLKGTAAVQTPISKVRRQRRLHTQRYGSSADSTLKGTAAAQTPHSKVRQQRRLHTQRYGSSADSTLKGTAAAQTPHSKVRQQRRLHTQRYGSSADSTLKGTAAAQTPHSKVRQLRRLHTQRYGSSADSTLKGTAAAQTPHSKVRQLRRLHTQRYGTDLHSAYSCNACNTQCRERWEVRTCCGLDAGGLERLSFPLGSFFSLCVICHCF